jgi:hypothetical protein
VISICCHVTFTELLRNLWGFTWHPLSCTQTRGQNWDQEFCLASSMDAMDRKV